MPSEPRPAAIRARNVAAGAVAAIVLWLLGHRTPAIVFLVVLAAVTVAAMCVPAVAAALDRATRAVERLVGRALTVVLLSALELIVFAPAWLLLRVLRHDPLAFGQRRGETSLWRPVATRELPRRQFAVEPGRGIDPAAVRGHRPAAGLRTALAALAVLSLLDAGIGALLHTGDSGLRAVGSGHRSSLLLNPNAAAGRGAPWLETLASGVDQAWYGSRYDPFLGWTAPDVSGTYLHVAGGVRRSYEPAGATASGGSGAGGRPLRVFFFGGSTMFGMFERDGYTIPSDFARLAAGRRLPVQVTNYGELAYDNWQELLLLEELVARGRTPDLAVFYDGVNELVGQFQYGPHTSPTHLEASEFARRIKAPELATAGSPLSALYQAWTNVSALVWLSRQLRGVPTTPAASPAATPFVSPWVPHQLAVAPASGRDAGALLAHGVTLARRLAASSGFHVAFFLQPMLYSTAVRDGEQPEVGSLGTDPVAWRRAYAVLRSDLRSPVVDIAGAFDRVKTPLFYDFVHTNELGADVVAQTLFAHLRPTLQRLLRARGR